MIREGYVCNRYPKHTLRALILSALAFTTSGMAFAATPAQTTRYCPAQHTVTTTATVQDTTATEQNKTAVPANTKLLTNNFAPVLLWSPKDIQKMCDHIFSDVPK